MSEHDRSNAIKRPKPATVVDLCQALKVWFGPIVRDAYGVPYEGKDAGNAYWMQAAASVWLELPDPVLE